jgi:mannose-6-phosphate isomerase-like protein (cupin superfamily)
MLSSEPELLRDFLDRSEAMRHDSRIPGLCHTRIGLAHEDDRRWLFVSFDRTYTARQARIAIVKNDCLLGGHYHNGAEFFVLLAGAAVFTVETVDPPHIREHYTLRPGDQLLVPPRVAHAVQVTEGTILQTFTEETYVPGTYDQVYLPLRSIIETGLEDAARLYTVLQS